MRPPSACWSGCGGAALVGQPAVCPRTLVPGRGLQEGSESLPPAERKRRLAAVRTELQHRLSLLQGVLPQQAELVASLKAMLAGERQTLAHQQATLTDCREKLEAVTQLKKDSRAVLQNLPDLAVSKPPNLRSVSVNDLLQPDA